MDPGINDAFGIELDSVKCNKAAAFVTQTLGELQRRGLLDEGVPYPSVRQAAIEEVCMFGGVDLMAYMSHLHMHISLYFIFLHLLLVLRCLP